MNDELLKLAANIVVAHIAHNQVSDDALPDLILSVYRALKSSGLPDPGSVEVLVPAMPIKRSVFRDYIVCLEDGKKLRMLKRHLQTSYGLTPEAYRAKWGLPMVAPSYGETRSSLAKTSGLGRKKSILDESADHTQPSEQEPAEVEPEVTLVKARRARGSRG